MNGALLPLLLLTAACQPAEPAVQEGAAADARMEWWREARFGMFIHWGLYAIPAGEWEGNAGYGEWILHSAQIPVAQYEQFRERFNPVGYDPEEWVLTAKRAGMRYLIITSKHHDGFCLFDSAHTDWDVMSTPYGRDILAALVAACRKHGMRIGWYHSIMDWHHPDYLPRRPWEQRSAEGADLARYKQHLRKQVTELLTNYGPIDVMWFDGEWEGSWTNEDGLAMYELCRSLQPDVIVNNRVDKGRGGMAGMTTGPGYAGDFGTPEQEIPATGLAGVDWETCMTMNRNWGYNAADDDWKSPRDLIRKLVDIASKGGNFLLNVGPRADGTFPPAAVERLDAMGRWMDRYGESIYGTSAGPFPALPWGRCTMKQSGKATSLYLQVFDWPAGGILMVPNLGSEPRAARLLGGEELEFQRRGADVAIRVPAQAPDPDASVLVLEIEGAPIVYRDPEIRAPAAILVDSLEVTMDAGSPELEIRYTLDGSEPEAASQRYAGPVTIRATTRVRARAFHDGKAVSGVAEARFEQVEPLPAVQIFRSAPGLACTLYEGDWNRLPDVRNLTPAGMHEVPGFVLEPDPRAEFLLRHYTGFLQVPADGVYEFALVADDGARLWLHSTLVVDNDGLHGPLERRGTVALAAGLHPVVLDWFNKTGGATLEVSMAPAGQPLRPLPAKALVH